MSARGSGFRGEKRFETRAEQRIDQLRVPPQSIEAEQAVLGGLMLAPDAYDRVADQIVEDDFYRRDHQLIYRAIRELVEKNRPFDAVTVGEWFESQGKAEQVAGEAQGQNVALRAALEQLRPPQRCEHEARRAGQRKAGHRRCPGGHGA